MRTFAAEFKGRAAVKTGDLDHRQFIRTALRGYEVARDQLRAELDALIAYIHGLAKSEFAYILTTFPLVNQGAKDATLAACRAIASNDIK